jgi:hypothetical protein
MFANMIKIENERRKQQQKLEIWCAVVVHPFQTKLLIQVNKNLNRF